MTINIISFLENQLIFLVCLYVVTIVSFFVIRKYLTVFHIIFLAFFECYEFIYLTLLRDFSFLNILALDFNLTNYSLFFTEFNEGLIFTLLIKLALLLYYVGHLSIVFVAQIANYFVLSFWLFFFLYTSFSSEKGESYFLTRRTI